MKMVSLAALLAPVVLLIGCGDQRPSRDAPPVEATDVQIEPAGEDAAPAAQTSPAVVTPAGSNPSFNCARAANNVERMICGDGELAKLDRDLAAAVQKARRIPPPEPEVPDLRYPDLGPDLNANGRAFLVRRNACADRDCVRDAYIEWLDEVGDMTREREMVGPVG